MDLLLIGELRAPARLQVLLEDAALDTLLPEAKPLMAGVVAVNLARQIHTSAAINAPSLSFRCNCCCSR